MPPRRRADFTLPEVALAATIALLAVTLAWPSVQGQLTRARRADATTALQRLQLAQEQYRMHHGLYAPTLAVLVGASSTLSAEGLYAIAIDEAGGDSYAASARALPDRAQRADADCARITLRVDQGMTDLGPDPRCWQR